MSRARESQEVRGGIFGVVLRKDAAEFLGNLNQEQLRPCGGTKMRNPFKRRRVTKFKHKVGSQIDCHKWASKMETQRLVSSKSYVKLIPKAVPTAVH